MRRFFVSIWAVSLVLATFGSAQAQDYQIKWYSINSGGGVVSGGAYKLNGSIGQPVAGYVQSSSILHWIGFWAGEVPTPTVAATIRDAKLLANGTFVSIAGKIATSGAADFNGFFYLEESDRSSGIRVAVPSWPVAGLTEGKVVNVIGTLGTTPAGERELVAPTVIIISTQAPLKPLGMSNRSIGGGNIGAPPLGQYGVTGGVGLNNVGILIETWGEITYKDPSNQFVLISDGSGAPLRVDTSTLASVPSSGYISVIGVSSLHQSGIDRLRLVLPRTDSDLTPR